MEILEILNKQLIFAEAKVEVIKELVAQFTPTENEAEPSLDFADETQTITDNTY